EGDFATLTFERTIRHPVEAVWEAITDPQHLAQWYLTEARLDPRRGGTIDYLSGPSRLHVTGKLLAWEPPRLFEHEWNVERRKGADAVPASRRNGVDLATGAGLREALAGAQRVIDVSSDASPDEATARAFFTASARHLQREAERAGVERLVVVSIVGVDRLS